MNDANPDRALDNDFAAYEKRQEQLERLDAAAEIDADAAILDPTSEFYFLKPENLKEAIEQFELPVDALVAMSLNPSIDTLVDAVAGLHKVSKSYWQLIAKRDFLKHQ